MNATNLFAEDDHRRPTVAFAGHSGTCRCGNCVGRRARFGEQLSHLGDAVRCETCELVLPELCFPKLADGERGQPCRNCGPHGTSLPPVPVEVVE